MVFLYSLKSCFIYRWFRHCTPTVNVVQCTLSASITDNDSVLSGTFFYHCSFGVFENCVREIQTYYTGIWICYTNKIKNFKRNTIFLTVNEIIKTLLKFFLLLCGVYCIAKVGLEEFKVQFSHYSAVK